MTTTSVRRDPLSFLGAELDSLRQQGLYRHLRVLEGEQRPKTTFDHRQVVNLSSNNYLGLTTHPKLREAAIEATRKFGGGSGSSSRPRRWSSSRAASPRTPAQSPPS